MIKHLYDEIAKRWCAKGGSVWLFSDPHFNDLDSHTFRGEEYPGDDEVVRRINSKVGKNDTIVFLGDIGDVEFIKKIKGYKVLIMGNQDKGASNYLMRWDAKWWPDYDVEELKKDGYTEVLDYPPGAILYGKRINKGLFDEVYEGPLMINEKVILSHEPIFPTIPFLFNIHGHVHNKNYEGDDHHLNICAEVMDYYPIHLVNFLKSGNIKHIDSIHRMTIDGAIKRKNKNK